MPSRKAVSRFARSFDARRGLGIGVAVASMALVGCQVAEHGGPNTPTALASITIDTTSFVFERGSRTTLTATVRNAAGDRVDAPVVWHSSNEKVADFAYGGVLVALDTGAATISAASLAVTSAPVTIRVVWVGPAKIVADNWTLPTAVTPGVTLRDSLRILVTNSAGAPVANARIAFAVAAGGGRISPPVATTGPTGKAAAQWTLGTAVGRNSITATVVHADGSADTLVANNPAVFTVSSYRALTIEAGAGQTGQILSPLPVAPSVKLVDSTGVPRRGVPVLFTAFNGGRVAVPLVSTDADGIASPGPWTLGDTPGDQQLVASVDDAAVSVHATGTGTPIHYTPAAVVAGRFSTCSIGSDGTVACWGQSPANGSGDTASFAAPTLVKGHLSATMIASGSSHFCALANPAGRSDVWCWGTNALVDTSGRTLNAAIPTELPSEIVWTQISAGGAHNCGIAAGQVAYCWGLNSSGQLGDLDTTRRLAPTPVAGSFKFAQIASGASHTCGLSTDGAAFCWGLNQSGQLGDGTTISRTSPTAVGSAAGVTLPTLQAIGAGDTFSCGLSIVGHVYCWGAVWGSTATTPVTYPDAPAFVGLSVGGGHACALTGDGTAYCWGDNDSGQVGDSTTTTRSSPTKVAGGLRFTQLSAGYAHTCGRTLDGAVACWGSNASGELGDRNSLARSVPRYIVLGVKP